VVVLKQGAARRRWRWGWPRSCKHNHFIEMCCGTEAGSYLRLTAFCITQLLRLKDLLGPVTRVKKKALQGVARRRWGWGWPRS